MEHNSQPAFLTQEVAKLPMDIDTSIEAYPGQLDTLAKSRAGTEPSCRLGAVIGTFRGPFLLLTPACVSVGLGLVIGQGSPFSLAILGLVILGALSAHIGVNVLNEYADFRSGLDHRTIRTPFSGGSGSLPACPQAASLARMVGYGAVLLTLVIGLVLLALSGPGLIPIGLIGVILVLVYTPWVTRHPLLCLIAPGLGFGALMVLGTQYALAGAFSLQGLAASLVPFFLVNNLLLLNQFPDVEADRSVGRDHVLIHWGKTVGRWLLLSFYAAAYGVILIGVLSGLFPLTTLMAGASLVLTIPTLSRLWQNQEDPEQLRPAMGLNVAISLVTPVLLGVGLALT